MKNVASAADITERRDGQSLAELFRGGRRDADARAADELARLQWIAHWLDDGFHLAGIRFGWDSIVKLIPVFGDTLGAIASLYLFQAFRRFNLPRVTQARMAVNIGVDYLVGMIPLLGTLFDVFWKPNVWNVGLLRRHLAATTIAESRRARRNDFVFVALASLIVFALFVATAAGAYWLLSQLISLLELH
jgi:hypothetical protein